jgi:hypothetical protein
LDLSDFEPEVSPKMEATSKSLSDKLLEGAGGAVAGGAGGLLSGKVVQNVAQSIPNVLTSTASAFGPLTKNQLMSVKEAYLPQAGEELSAWQKLSQPGGVAKGVEESFLTPMSEIDKVANESRLKALEGFKEVPVSQKEYNKIGEQIAYKESFPIDQSAIDRDVSQQGAALGEQTKARVEKSMSKDATSQLDKFAQIKVDEEIARIKSTTLNQLTPDDEALLRKNIMLDIKANPKDYNFEPLRDIESIMGEYKDLTEKRRKLPDQVTTARSPKKANLENMPSLKGRTFKDASERKMAEVNNILSLFDSPNLGVIPGDKAWEDLQKIREMAYNEAGEITAETASEFQEELRKLVGDKNPYASELMKQSSEGIAKVETGAIKGFYNLDPKKVFGDISRFNMDEDSMKKLSQAMLFDLDKAGSKEPVETLKYLKGVLSPEQFKSLDLASIRNAVNQGKGIFENVGKDIATTAVSPTFGSMRAGLNALGSPKMQVALATLPEKFASAFPKLSKVGTGLAKYAPKIGLALGTGGGAIAAQAAEEGLDSTPSGPTPSMVEQTAQVPFAPEEYAPFWESKGMSREEGVQKARLLGFKEGLEPAPSMGMDDGTFSAEKYTKDKQYQEMAAGDETDNYVQPSLESNYVEQKPRKDINAFDKPSSSKPNLKDIKFTSTDGPEMTQMADAMDASGDKAAQEYSRVLRQVISSPDSKKSAVLYTLNQQPAFRALVKKMKGEE